ncbi:sensor histidine kinase [Dehalogenimonas etheniformans]|uniref:Signal transduction histidine kinase subgroup 3 dimerisation and phosphoacceptor domain-containing protein n=1 Tax=Dehalogenimonas etheniformans TaxID=1536648 RepID=A0A2P5PA73_9CHLR|nr:histidine kinase [Dehalogenimonas etheniformans]PPD59180.1 hypothetical protein JP09_000435 [Dehalogenimonas etheniformans]QNT75778.1 hypothetical protein HX448_03285 [Dehalogenimonas etheniformans]
MICTRQSQIPEISIGYVQAQERERESIALEIHDRIIQPLTGVFHELETLEMLDHPDTCEMIRRIRANVKFTIQETRDVINGIYPSTLAKYHLISLITNELDALNGHEGFECHLKIQCNTANLCQTSEITLYRVFHEAIFNIKRHARATIIFVSLCRIGSSIRMLIEDNGNGFNIEKALQNPRPSGLKSMKHRIEMVGGTFLVRSNENGTAIEALVPIQ